MTKVAAQMSITLNDCDAGPMDPHEPQDASGWMERRPEAGLLEQLEVHIAPVVPNRRGDLHVLPRLVRAGTCLYDVAGGSVRTLQNLSRQRPERRDQPAFPHHV
jgi:hypothetical protein